MSEKIAQIPGSEYNRESAERQSESFLGYVSRYLDIQKILQDASSVEDGGNAELLVESNQILKNLRLTLEFFSKFDRRVCVEFLHELEDKSIPVDFVLEDVEISGNVESIRYVEGLVSCFAEMFERNVKRYRDLLSEYQKLSSTKYSEEEGDVFLEDRRKMQNIENELNELEEYFKESVRLMCLYHPGSLACAIYTEELRKVGIFLKSHDV